MLKLGIPGPSHPLFFYRFLIMFVFSYVFCLWLSVVCTSSSILWHEVNLNCLFGIMCQVCSTKKCKQEVNQVGKSGQPVLQRTFLPVCLSALDEFTFCSQPPPHPPRAMSLQFVRSLWAKSQQSGAEAKGTSLPGEQCGWQVGLISCVTGFQGCFFHAHYSTNKGSINLCAGQGI